MSQLAKKKTFVFSRSIRTLDPFEGVQLVIDAGGHALPSVTTDTDYFVVSDDLANGAAHARYIDEAKAKGAQILSEIDFWKLVEAEPGQPGIANRWVVVDDYLEDGKTDVSNAPAWDNTIAPYKLFIQHGTAKTTGNGGWKVIGCGALSDTGYTMPNIGSIVRVGKRVMRNSIPEGAVPWAEWRNDIGSVVVGDSYAPTSCMYLFDGLARCSSFDLSGLDTSRTTSMASMFRGCSSVDYFMKTNRFSTNLVEDMTSMFSGCTNTQVINCIGWNLSRVKSMYAMFENCPAAVLFDEWNIPLPKGIQTDRLFDTSPKRGSWLQKM